MSALHHVASDLSVIVVFAKPGDGTGGNRSC